MIISFDMTVITTFSHDDNRFCLIENIHGNRLLYIFVCASLTIHIIIQCIMIMRNGVLTLCQKNYCARSEMMGRENEEVR